MIFDQSIGLVFVVNFSLQSHPITLNSKLFNILMDFPKWKSITLGLTNIFAIYFFFILVECSLKNKELFVCVNVLYSLDDDFAQVMNKWHIDRVFIRGKLQLNIFH